MPSSEDEPSPSLPIYMPGRRRMCSFQSRDLMLSSVYLADIELTAFGRVRVIVRVDGARVARRW